MPGHRQSTVGLAIDIVGLHLLSVPPVLKTLTGKQSTEQILQKKKAIKGEVMSLQQGFKMRGES